MHNIKKAGIKTMIQVATDWNPKQALLKEIILKPDRFDEAMNLCLEMHSLVHVSEVSVASGGTFEDDLWDGLDETTFRTMPTVKDDTIAWNIWHITRIEDITANILIADNAQVFRNDNWQGKMNVTISDTGNAMTTQDIIAFSATINMNQLRNYRKEVGKRTRGIIKQLKPGDLKRKVVSTGLQRILDEGGVAEDSRWLIDFWGKKTVAGILLMPIMRHQIVHLNDSLRIKEKCQKLNRVK
jgi:hypothetical protein